MADINAWNENADRENTITAAGGWVAPGEFLTDIPEVGVMRGGMLYYGRDFYPKPRSPIGGHPSRRKLRRRVRHQERELARVYARLRDYERERRDRKPAQPLPHPGVPTIIFPNGRISTYDSLDAALRAIEHACLLNDAKP